MLTRHTSQLTILDAENFRVGATASTQSIDGKDEIILAAGWQLGRVGTSQVKLLNAHNSRDIRDVLGNVETATVEGDRLAVELRYAVKQSAMAALAWDMTLGGFLTGYSVGAKPLIIASLTDIKGADGKVKWRANAALFKAAAAAAGMNPADAADRVTRIIVRAELTELSVVSVPCNPDAMVRAYQAGAITDESFARVGFDDSTRALIEKSASAWHGMAPEARHNICALLTSISRHNLQKDGNSSRAIEPAQRERIERHEQQRAELLTACKALAAKLADLR